MMLNRIKHIIWSLFLFHGVLLQSIHAQTSLKDSLNVDGDSVFIGYDLSPVYILPRLYFSKASDWYAYNVIRRKVLKVYPFAQLAGEKLEILDERLSKMKGRKKRLYKKGIERYIREVIEPQLKELTVTEGRILVKLIHRQTGMTVYDFLKKYKSGLSAFWWQRMAKLYKIDLKSRFEPETIKEDFWIEDILQRAFKDGLIEEQPAKIYIPYQELYSKWMEKRPKIKRTFRKKPLLLRDFSKKQNKPKQNEIKIR